MGKELELAIKIAGKVDKSLGAAVNSAQAQLNSISKFANKAMTAATIAVAGAGVKIVNDSVKTYKDYQSAISSAAATGGIARGTADYEALDAAAREAGRTTVKTAKESANALEYMMLAGWNVQDSTKALMPILKLSAATGADLATTSDLVTDSMANMGLGINDLNRYLDISAAANNKTNQTATQLLEAYIGVGGTLKNLNTPVEESAAILGVLANRGTKGAEAGTALSAILVNMQKRTGEASKAMSQLGVSMYDNNGAARSIIDVFQDISDKTSGMTEQQRNLMYQMIGGKSHVDSFSKIMAGFNDTTSDGTKEVYSLINAFNQSSGALDNLYAIKTDTLEGSLATLNSAFDDMKISIGEKISPMLNDAVKDLTAKMPDIENVIVNSLEKIIPAISKVINYIVDNSDKVISTITGIAKAFVGFKITTGTIKGITGITTLISNLSKLKAARDGATVLSGITKTLTGLGTGGIAVGAVVGITAGIVALTKAAYDAYVQSKEIGTSLNPIGDNITKHMNSMQKLTDLRKEFGELEFIINSKDSNEEQIKSAQTRIEEIRNLLSEEYNLNIGCDTADVEKALNLLNEKEYMETKGNAGAMLAGLETGAAEYAKQMQYIEDTEKNIADLQETINTCMENYYEAIAKGDTAAADSHLEWANAWKNRLEDLQNDKWYSMYQTETEAYQNNAKTAVEGNYATVQYEILNGKDATQSIAALKNSLKYTGTEGFEYAAAIGDTVESAVSNIALVKSGFDNVTKATEAGNDAVLSVIGNIKSLGDMQGIFDGLDSSGVADKLTDMAHTMDLIPENKSISIDADGNFQIIAEAENQIASLRSQGNVNVSVNADGDFSILNTVTGEIQTLQGMGATNLQVNADGNIDVLNQAHDIIATIDSKNAQINIDGQAYGIDQIEQAKAAAEGLHDKNVSTQVVGTFNGQEVIATAVDYQSKLQDVNRAQTINGTFSGKDDIATALSYQSQLQDKSVTYTVTYKQNGTPPENNARGTDNFSGGITYLNDQRGIADPREVVEYGGARWWYEGRDVLANIPKGARIYTAAESRDFIDGSHRNGLGRVPFDGYIAELHAGERVLTSEEASEYGDYRLGDYLDMLLELMDSNPQNTSSSDDHSSQRIVFSPTYHVVGGDTNTVREVGRLSFNDFKEFMEEYERDRARKAF